jgi:glutamate-ammonia-ligase adenylyltransferase
VTRAALAALALARWVAPEIVRALAEGYAFLRRLEHRLRIERDQPGDAIPESAAARLALVRRLGYEGAAPDPVDAFITDLTRHREAIRRAYAVVVGEESAAS